MTADKIAYRHQLARMIRYAKTYFYGMGNYLVFAKEGGRWTARAMFAEIGDAIAWERAQSMQTTLREIGKPTAARLAQAEARAEDWAETLRGGR